MSIKPHPETPENQRATSAAAADPVAGAADRVPLDEPRLRTVMNELGMGELWVSEHTGSTNDDLAQRATHQPLTNLSVETTEHQMAGHGRLGRGWQAPARSSLATSIYFRPAPGFNQAGLAWLSMLCSTAMVWTLREDAGVGAGLKWPNDVVAGGSKVCGVLAQLVMRPEGPVVIVGAGLNVSLTAAELPVATAASLGTLGAATLDRTLLLEGYLRRVTHLFRAFEGAGGDASTPARYPVPQQLSAPEADSVAHIAPGQVRDTSTSLREVVRSAMVTIGHQVDAHLPNGTVLRGTATDLDAEGALRVRDEAGTEHHVLAGDVQHLRRSDGSYA